MESLNSKNILKQINNKVHKMKIMQHNHHLSNEIKMKNKMAQDKRNTNTNLYIAQLKH